MTTNTLYHSLFSRFAPRAHTPEAIAVESERMSKASIASMALVMCFVLYFLVPHVGMAATIFRFNMMYIVVVPFVTFLLSTYAVYHARLHHERGIALGYLALSITTVYFIVALAIPLVLIGLYIIYSFLV